MNQGYVFTKAVATALNLLNYQFQDIKNVSDESEERIGFRPNHRRSPEEGCFLLYNSHDLKFYTEQFHTVIFFLSEGRIFLREKPIPKLRFRRQFKECLKVS